MALVWRRPIEHAADLPVVLLSHASALAAGLWLVAAAAALAWVVGATASEVSRSLDITRFASPGRAVVSLPGSTAVRIFWRSDRPASADPWMAVVGPDGRPLRVTSERRALDYPSVENLGPAVGRFETTTPGPYVVSADRWEAIGVLSVAIDPVLAVAALLIRAAVVLFVAAAAVLPLALAGGARRDHDREAGRAGRAEIVDVWRAPDRRDLPHAA
jgi:hypothetical protein